MEEKYPQDFPDFPQDFFFWKRDFVIHSQHEKNSAKFWDSFVQQFVLKLKLRRKF